jgi:hypothetical protein
MPTRHLPRDPHLDHLRGQARTLQRRIREGSPEAVALVREFHPRYPTLAARTPEATGFTRAQAQLVVARSYGFPSWARLREHLEVVDRYSRSPYRPSVGGTLATRDDLVREFLLLACLTYGDDHPDRWRRASELLVDNPGLATATIHTMAAAGEAAAARELLALRPDQARLEGGPHRWEPLMYAAYSRIEPLPGRSTVDVARALLDHGADPDVGYLWDGLASPFTALTGAFGRGEGDQPPHPERLALARLLLDRGADPNDSQTLYNVGLDDHNDLEHLRLLLSYGLGRGTGGPWHARLAGAHPTPAQLLEDELLIAAEQGSAERARLVLAQGVDVDGLGTRHPVREGATAYQLALRGGHTEVADLLRAAGAAPAEDWLELLGACVNGDRAAVRRLMAGDPDLAARAIAARPHHIVAAARRDRIEAVALMLELGFDVNARETTHPHRQTALHAAAWNGSLAMVRYLVGHGADPSLPDASFGGTPSGWAEHRRTAEESRAGGRAVVDRLDEVIGYLRGLTGPG